MRWTKQISRGLASQKGYSSRTLFSVARELYIPWGREHKILVENEYQTIASLLLADANRIQLLRGVGASTFTLIDQFRSTIIEHIESV